MYVCLYVAVAVIHKYVHLTWHKCSREASCKNLSKVVNLREQIAHRGTSNICVNKEAMAFTNKQSRTGNRNRHTFRSCPVNREIGAHKRNTQRQMYVSIYIYMYIHIYIYVSYAYTCSYIYNIHIQIHMCSMQEVFIRSI